MVRCKIHSLTALVALVLTTVMVGIGPATADEPMVTTPDNFRADVGVSSVTVEWDRSVSREAEILFYSVRVGSRWFVTTEPTVTDLYLAKDTTYPVVAQATDAEYNRSEWSEPFFFTTPDDFPVTTPDNVRTSTSPGMLTVEWDPSSSDAGMLDYTVKVTGGSGGPVARRTFDPDTTATFSFPPGGDLEVTVQARDRAFRYSDTSEPVAVTVEQAADWQPPTKPENLRVQFDERGRLQLLSWDASEGTGPITYHVLAAGDEIESTKGTQMSDGSFLRCTEITGPPIDLTVIATAHGFQSPESDPVQVCFR